jgi:acetyl esterase/lipase
MQPTCEELQVPISGGRVVSGDLYRPSGDGLHPLVIGTHGGGWNEGSRKAFRFWGPRLAQDGFALLAVDRWRFPPGDTPYPTVVEDLRRVVDFASDSAASLQIDAGRIALMGASSGAYLAAMAALQGGSEALRASRKVTAVVAVYGVYDLAAEWLFEQAARPLDKSAEALLGCALYDNRALYFEASPISHCIRANNRMPFLVAWGTQDDVVSERLHSEPFVRSLALADFDVRTCALPYAQHYWLFEPFDQPSSHSAAFAPHLLHFLKSTI